MKKLPYSNLFPEKSDKRIIAALRPLAKRCDKTLNFVQQGFRFSTLKQSPPSRTQLAEILVDFAMDIHFDTGIWAALEKYNTELFGTPLPLILPSGTKPSSGISMERVHFLLWNIYSQLGGCELSNLHDDMFFAVEEMTKFLNNVLLPLLPDVSPVKDFLDKPNDYGWEIKKKLIWLGMHSYMFRLLFDAEFEIRWQIIANRVHRRFYLPAPYIWSGLGANDILAVCLDILDE